MMDRLRRLLVALAVSLLLPWTACAEEESWSGKPAPEFDLQCTDGTAIRLSELVGKKVIWLNFWGLRCGPCIRELPALQKLYEQYKDQGLVIVGVNADGVDVDFIRKSFAEREDLKAIGTTFPIAADPELSVVDAYGLMGAPLNVMIDKKGVIQYRHEGYEDGDEARYAEVAKKLLAQ